MTNDIVDAVAAALAAHGARPGRLIPILHAVQQQLGHIPPDAQRVIARGLELPLSRVHGVVTFYHLFHTEPQGRHTVRLCQGTACHVSNSHGILDAVESHLGIHAGETTSDGRLTLETVACLGACALSPVMVIDNAYHGHLTEREALDLVDGLSSSERES